MLFGTQIQTKIHYEKYNLKRNPFPYVGIPAEFTTSFTDRKYELSIVEESLRGSLDGSSSHVVLVGGYGNGKTATLLYVKSKIDQNLPNVLTIYMSNPGENLQQFYNNFIQGLGIVKLEQIIWSYLIHVTGNRKIKEKIEKGNILITEVIEKAKKALQEDVNYADFTNAILKIILEETKFLSWRYLCGENIDGEQRRLVDVVNNINSDEKALQAFISIKKIVNNIGIKLICILVDELESIELLILPKKQRILNGLRRLIDHNPYGLSFIMSCAPESWSSIISEYHAFSERIFREVVLFPLSDKTTKDLIITYLSRQRISSQKNRTLIYPFTEESVKEILLTAHGNIRRVLMICNRLIDEGARLNYPLLTPSVLRKMLPELFQEEK
jgi:P-loop Domain of unknown function (DUF2791)